MKYHVLAPMLLNEMQKQQHTIAQLRLEAGRREVQETQIATLLARVDALESQRGESTGTDR